ncbi:MAG: MFS transporter [Chloroflexi bacterium]|nr:MFS transporter [Chloroflexota bacterium]
MLAMFLAAMEVNIVATAMPSIVGKLGGFADFTWVFSGFLLAQAATIPIYGKLADLYGRRPVLAAGMGLFLAGSFLCGEAGSMTQLIVFRTIQGIGAGAVQPIASTIIGDIFTLEERARMQGWLSSVWAIASLIGPLLGGFIVERLHWAWIFWINIPLGLLSIVGVSLFLRETVARSKHAVDYLGAVLLASGVSLFLFGLLQGGVAWPWTSPQSIGLLTGAVGILVGFVIRELHAPEPIVPLGLFRNRVVATADSGFLFIGGLVPSVTSFVPLYVQGVSGGSATTAGFTLMPMSIGWPLASTLSGRVILRFGFRGTAVSGAVITIVGAVLMLMGARADNVLGMGLANFVLGAGLGFLSTSLIVAIQSAVPWSSRGVATASTMFSRQLGSSLWVAILGSLLNAVLLSRLSSLPSSVRSAAGGDEAGLTSLLLNEQARATLDATVLTHLEATLAGSLQVVFVGIVVTTVAALVVAWFVPGGSAQAATREHATTPPD